MEALMNSKQKLAVGDIIQGPTLLLIVLSIERNVDFSEVIILRTFLTKGGWERPEIRTENWPHHALEASWWSRSSFEDEWNVWSLEGG
jgi:hypothetical protein